MRKIVAFGGGVNGTAMLIAMKRVGDIPDAILFADTGGEPPWVYDHIATFSKWLVSIGFPEITVVTHKNKHHRRITLEQELLTNGSLPSIAYGLKSCSEKHKTRPQQKWVKWRFGKESITWYVGFDSSEERRVKTNPQSGHANKYPLIELGWDRARCILEIEAEGVLVPKKSSCFFCPNMRKHEILSLPDDLKLRAIAIERGAALTKLKGLGRRFNWEELINGHHNEANAEEKAADQFKNATGEDLNPIACECID